MKTILNKLMALFMKHTVPKDKKPVLIFDIGSLQVYHYQTDEEFRRNAEPQGIFWSESRMNFAFGPFASINAAMNHYTATLATYNNNKRTNPPPIPKPNPNVLYVDFKNKKPLK